MLLKLLYVLTITTLVRSDTTLILNKVVDDLLLLAEEEFAEEVALKEVSFPYKYHWLFFSKSGNVNCEDGTVKSLKSLKRTGDVTLKVNEQDEMKWKVSMGLEVFGFRFQKCTVDWFMIPKGPMKGEVGNNSIEVEFTVDLRPIEQHEGNYNYLVTVDDIKLDLYKNVQLKLEGTGVLHWIEEKILNLVAGGNAARQALNDVIENEFRSRLPKFEITIKPLVQLHSAALRSHAEKS